PPGPDAAGGLPRPHAGQAHRPRPARSLGCFFTGSGFLVVFAEDAVERAPGVVEDLGRAGLLALGARAHDLHDGGGEVLARLREQRQDRGADVTAAAAPSAVTPPARSVAAATASTGAEARGELAETTEGPERCAPTFVSEGVLVPTHVWCSFLELLRHVHDIS